MRSIRLRLFSILLATTGAVWLFAVLWTYFSVQHQVERVLDARLMEAARMVSSLITDHHIDVAAAIDDTKASDALGSPDAPFDVQGDYRRQLSCQIWSLQGKLVSRSASAPDDALTDNTTGFSETTVDGVRWRVFAVVNTSLNVRVLIGDSLEIRDRLVADVVKGQLVPAVAMLPILALLIWFSVGKGLGPLNRIATLLGMRTADELHAIEQKDAPSEIKPLLKSLNSLFLRVEEAREREKSFIAYAAHELKTPLAGLKTQAQVALKSHEEDVRNKALAHISTSVDRTGRLVRQLIDLASVDSTDRGDEVEVARLDRVLEDIRCDLEGLSSRRSVSLEFDLPQQQDVVVRNINLLRLALRNVIENAIQYAPRDTSVTIRLQTTDAAMQIEVIDRGQGIAVEDQASVRERFKRGHAPTADGSGLGLAIVDMAMKKLGGRLDFRAATTGFVVVLTLPGK
jgi:two-component system sensor histidine kinase QseC